MADDAEAATIDLDVIASVARQGSSDVSLTLVEDAGRWRVSITPRADMAVMAKTLALPV